MQIKGWMKQDIVVLSKFRLLFRLQVNLYLVINMWKSRRAYDN